MTDPPDTLHGLGAQNTGRALVKTTRGGGHVRDLMTPVPLRRFCRVVAEDPGRLHARVGSHRLLGRFSGEQLPRIC